MKSGPINTDDSSNLRCSPLPGFEKARPKTNEDIDVDTHEEKTEVWYGEESAMNGLLRTMARVKSRADIVGDSLAPSFSMGVNQIRKEYDNFVTRSITIRFITEITKDNLSYCKELMKYAEVRHLDNVRGNMAVSDTEYVATSQLKGEAKPVTQTIYSNVKVVLEQQRYFFETLWLKAIPVEQRIREIEEGITYGRTEIIDNSIRAKDLLLSLLSKAEQEIMMVFPSFKAVERQSVIGVIEILKQKAKENLRIMVLSPIDKSVKDILEVEKSTYDTRKLIVRQIVKQQNLKSTILIVDKKHLLAMELRDDSQTTFERAIGLATYSTSTPTVLSHISIFESLWTQTEMNERLQAHDRLQNDFINMAAHEIRNPSQAILGYVELAIMDYDVTDREKNLLYLEIISRNAERLVRLTGNILTTARIENNKLELRKDMFDLGKLVTDRIEDFNSKLSKLQHKNIKIFGRIIGERYDDDKPKSQSQTESSMTLEITDSGGLLVKADKEKIEQVIVNLLENAVKFSKGNIFVEIKRNILEGVVSVKDTGPGIDPEIASTIFSKFSSKSDVGTGLGLYISKGIVEAHGGRIWAQNNIDKKGATFSFSLPLNR
jgi:two-component system, OmpR family, sensor histidine kinase VicK